MINPEQDSKWTCNDCGEIWYDEQIIYYENCIKCNSENIEED